MAPKKNKFQGKRNNLKIKSKFKTGKGNLKRSKKAKDTEEKSSTSEISEECHCTHGNCLENTKGGILKRKISSSDSIVAKYIKSGMDHVASFIVESAIRFGKEHGVVIQDKNTPNVYEILPPSKPYYGKFKRIRFRVPDKTLTKEEQDSNNNNLNSGSRRYKSKSSSWSSKTDSLEDILPLLEKLKDEGDVVNSDLDIRQFNRKAKSKTHSRKKGRHKKKHVSLNKRCRSADNISKSPEEKEGETLGKTTWKRFKRDSLELGRQRLRGSTSTRKVDSVSPSPY